MVILVPVYAVELPQSGTIYDKKEQKEKVATEVTQNEDKRYSPRRDQQSFGEILQVLLRRFKNRVSFMSKISEI
jgi:hypothetical protein